MPRVTGEYRSRCVGGEDVRAFVPHPLPPAAPPLDVALLAGPLAAALAALDRLKVAGAMVPSADWFLYGFVRKEAVITSRIEGTQATLNDVLNYEATGVSERPADVEEVCGYVEALNYARRELADPGGLPVSTRLLCEAHRQLMHGERGAGKQPGTIRTSQNWIGGTRPGNARFVPPPASDVPEAMAALERWIHRDDPETLAIPSLVRAGLAHVQFETIHPFLDGNGRIGRLLIALLLEHWDLLPSPLLYLSVAIRRRQQEYYQRLAAVRTEGDWEGWSAWFLDRVREAADDAVDAAAQLHALIGEDRRRLLQTPGATVTALRLFDLLPTHPLLTLSRAIEMLETTKPTAIKAIGGLEAAGVLKEVTGRRRDRLYAYQRYLDVLTADTE